MNLKDKKVVVVGLGLSGTSAAKFLAHQGARVFATDESESISSREELAALGVTLELGRHSEDFFTGCELVVASPGVCDEAAPLLFAKQRNVPVIGELELGARFFPGRIVAVTGTNGKSTTTELIGNLLGSAGIKTVVCGNIGTPITSLVDEASEDTVAAVEVSSFQLDRTVDFRPYISVLLNVTEDHFQRHGDLEQYKAAKLKIFANQLEQDWAVVHSDLCDETAISALRCNKVFYGLKMGPVKIEGETIVFSGSAGSEPIISLGAIPVEGRHNIENIMCAAIVGRILGLQNMDIERGIITFKGLSHRFERIGVFNDIEYIDDSKATNIDATKRALESIDKKVVLIAGGIDKGGDYWTIAPVLQEVVSAMVLIGEASEKIARVFEDEVKILKADSMADAVVKAKDFASPGEAVMLSPMCSSFDMFTSYKERGEVFQREVKKINNE